MQKGVYYWTAIKISLLIIFIGVLFFFLLHKMFRIFMEFEGFTWMRGKYLNVVKNACIAGLAGLVTNMGAIWLLFRPYKPIGWRYFKFGLIPANKEKLIKNISRGITEEFLDIDTIAHHIDKKITFNELLQENVITQSFAYMLSHMIPKNLKKIIIYKTISKIDFQMIIMDKIHAMDIIMFEKLVKRATGETLIAIEVLGGILGAFMGTVFSLFL